MPLLRCVPGRILASIVLLSLLLSVTAGLSPAQAQAQSDTVPTTVSTVPDSLSAARSNASIRPDADRNAPIDTATSANAPPQPAPLPPLSVVVEYARENAPKLAVQEAIIARSQHEVERTEKRWMEGVTAGLSSSYGSFGNSTVDAVEIGQRLEVGIRVSLFDLLGRDASVGVFRERLEAAKRQRRVLAQAVRKQVIERYYAAKQARELTVVQSRGYTSTRTQLQMAEASFRQGTLSVDKLSRVTEVMAKAEARFRKARLRYEKAYDQLERLIGTGLDELRGSDLQQATVTSPDASGSR
jgi:Outer membrane protein